MQRHIEVYRGKSSRVGRALITHWQHEGDANITRDLRAAPPPFARADFFGLSVVQPLFKQERSHDFLTVAATSG